MLETVLGAGIFFGGGFALYRLVFGLLYFLLPPRHVEPISGKTGGQKRFLFVVPARNEELVLGRCLESLRGLEHPAELVKCVVIADRCGDGTARVAWEMGVQCLERKTAEGGGKGEALDWFLEQYPLGDVDAVCFVDADCRIDAGAPKELEAVLDAGARVVQMANGVANPTESWLTMVTHLSHELQNHLFYEARTKLGLSAAVMGTGFCVDGRLLREMGWKAVSDWEFTGRLLERGTKVDFTAGVKVMSDFPATLGAAWPQRLRWSAGRFGVWSRCFRPRVTQFLWKPTLKGLDGLALLFGPSHSVLFNWNVTILVASWLLPVAAVWRWMAGSVVLLQTVHLGLGVLNSGMGLRMVVAVTFLPLYCGWKGLVELVAAGNVVLGRSRGWGKGHRGAGK